MTLLSTTLALFLMLLFATNVALVKSGTIPKQKVLGFSIGMSNAFPAILNIVIRSIIAM